MLAELTVQLVITHAHNDPVSGRKEHIKAFFIKNSGGEVGTCWKP